MKSRDQLEQEKLTPQALEKIVSFHSDTVEEIKDSLQKHEWVLIGMAQNPYVKRARKFLESKNIKFQYIEKGSYLRGWKVRLAIKLYTGWPTFPQIFHKGRLIGGFSDLQRYLKD